MKDIDTRFWRIFTMVASFIVLLCAGFWITALKVEPDSTERGQFGDMFGALNTLFSGLALAGVVAALVMQRRELGATLKEMEESKNAQKRGAEIARINGIIQAETTIMNYHPKEGCDDQIEAAAILLKSLEGVSYQDHILLDTLKNYHNSFSPRRIAWARSQIMANSDRLRNLSALERLGGSQSHSFSPP